jgi:hypothetical protein
MIDETPIEIVEAIRHFQARAEKSLELTDLLETRSVLGKLDFNDVAGIETRARLYIKIADARYAAGQISEHEHLFHRCYAIENLVHETRWLNGCYDEVLDPVSEKMREIERARGLSDDEYWPVGDAPEDYQALNIEYGRILDRKLEAPHYPQVQKTQ